jgi:hypothetical protein
VFSPSIAHQLSADAPAAGLAHTVASGGARGILAHAPADERTGLDAAIRAAVGSALGTTFLVAGVVGVVGGAVVLALMREGRGERERARAAAPAAAAR